MTVEIDRKMYTDAIFGSLPASRELSEEMLNRGLMTYVGGFRDDYLWDREAVKLLPDDELIALYNRLRREAL